MANATPLCIPHTRIFPDPVLMGVWTQKHVRNMVYGLYNSTFNSQTDPTILRFLMNLLDHMVMYLAYIHISNIIFYRFTSRPFILLHSIFPLFLNTPDFPFDHCSFNSYFRIHPYSLLLPVTYLRTALHPPCS